MVAVLLGTALAGESSSLGGLVAMGAIIGSVVLITCARACSGRPCEGREGAGSPVRSLEYLFSASDP